VNGQRPSSELDACEPGNAIIDLADQASGDSLERIRSLDAQSDDALVEEVQVLLPQKLGESGLRLLEARAIGVQGPELLTRPGQVGIERGLHDPAGADVGQQLADLAANGLADRGRPSAWSRGVNVTAARNAATATSGNATAANASSLPGARTSWYPPTAGRR
jgi:hypothetical protein